MSTDLLKVRYINEFGVNRAANSKQPNSEWVILGRRFQSLLVNGLENSRISARGRIPMSIFIVIQDLSIQFQF